MKSKSLEIESIYPEGKNKIIIDLIDDGDYGITRTLKKPFWFDWYSEHRYNDGYMQCKRDMQSKLQELIGVYK